MIRFYHWLARPVVTGLLLLLPLLAFGYYFLSLQFNILWFDEYENIPFFLTHFVDATTWRERIDALLRPNNEHRLLYQRLVVYGQYLLTGEINFNGLMVWGNLGMLVVLYLFYRTLRRQNLPAVYLLPVPPILFIAQNYLLSLTALYTLQYLAIIMLILVTLYWLAGNTERSFIGATCLGVFSTFSMGNGLLVWPAGAIVLLYQRQWGRLGVWVCVGASAIWGYFYGYPVQQGNTEGFAFVVTHPLETIRGLLVYAGSLLDLLPAMPLQNRTWLPLAGGVVVLSFLTGWLLRMLFYSLTERRSGLTHYDGFMVGCVSFLLANTLLIAIFRIRFGFMLVLWSTYRTYILILWVVAYLVLLRLLSETNRMRFLPVAWLLFTGIGIISYITYVPEAIDRRHHMQGLTFNQRYSRVGLGGTRNSALAVYIEKLTIDMERRGWYSLPKPVLADGETQLLGPVRDTLSAPPMTFTTTPEYITVRSNDPAYQVDRDRETYLVFKSDAYTYVMSARRPWSVGRNPFARPPGFVAEMPVQMIQPGRYRLGIFRTEGGKGVSQFSGQFADVK